MLNNLVLFLCRCVVDDFFLLFSDLQIETLKNKCLTKLCVATLMTMVRETTHAFIGVVMCSVSCSVHGTQFEWRIVTVLGHHVRENSDRTDNSAMPSVHSILPSFS